MQENIVLRSGELAPVLESVQLDRVLAGSPQEGALALLEAAGMELGIWEMTAGAVSDTEVAEVFVVLEGSATVHFTGQDSSITVRAGDVVRLAAGTQTVWDVSEKIRKFYLTLPEGHHD